MKNFYNGQKIKFSFDNEIYYIGFIRGKYSDGFYIIESDYCNETFGYDCFVLIDSCIKDLYEIN